MTHKIHGYRAASKRHDEAVERQNARNLRSDEEQLKLIAKRPGFSERERARLESPEASHE